MKAKKVWDKLVELGWECRLVSSNRPNKGQWYECKVGEENPEFWRIDATKGFFEMSAFPNGTANISFEVSLGSYAGKVGVELNDEYSINFNIWGHNIGYANIEIFSNYKRIEEFMKLAKSKYKKFLKLCRSGLK